MWFEEFQDGSYGGQPSWMSEHHEFTNSESPYHPHASHQVLAQSDLMFGSKMWFEDFQDGQLGYRKGSILAILNLHFPLMPLVSARSDLWLKRRLLEQFQDGHHGGHLGYKGMHQF